MIITTNSVDGSLTVSIETGIMDRFNTIGYDELTDTEKNSIVMLIAIEKEMLLNDITPEHILQYHRDAKTAILKSQCNIDIENGFTAANGHFYRTNRDDQINMIGQKGELTDDPTITTVQWKTEDEGYMVHSREEWLSIYKEAFTTIKSKTLKYNIKKGAVKNAKSHAEILAVKWYD